MFFPERIRSIKPGHRVLEIGPGGTPFARSDVLLERRFEDAGLTHQQRAGQVRIDEDPRLVWFDGGRFPFKDHEFDYVICSHVLEHVPAGELDEFLGELQRVARGGYLEYPNIFYELLNWHSVHIWLMNYRGGCTLLLDKNSFRSNYVHQCVRELVYGADDHLFKVFKRHPDFFFPGFEWQGRIKYQVVSSFDELINEEDLARAKAYASAMTPRNFMYKVKRRLRRQLGLDKPGQPGVDPSAIVLQPELVRIAPSATIAEHTLIQPQGGAIQIGEQTCVGARCTLQGGRALTIGRHVLIGPRSIVAGQRGGGEVGGGELVIEDDVQIGADCIIAGAIRLGRQASIAAGSVIDRDVQPFETVPGREPLAALQGRELV